MVDLDSSLKNDKPVIDVQVRRDAASDLGLNVASIGVDTLSLDPGNSADFAVHFSWLPGGRFGIENMANLDQLPAAGATVFIGAPKHKTGTGGPARVMAVV